MKKIKLKSQIKLVGKIILVMLLLFLSSCSSTSKRDVGGGVSGEEKRFITYFKDDLLVSEATLSLRLQEVKVNDLTDISPVGQSLVKPFVYSRLLSTAEVEKNERTAIFIAQMLPHILITKHYIQQEKKIVNQLIENTEKMEGRRQNYSLILNNLMIKHKAHDTNELLEKLSDTPTSILLAEAAYLSNWGSSAAYVQANNPFKHSIESKSDAKLLTNEKDDELIIYKKYSYTPEAVLDHLQVINSQHRYGKFRKMRSVINDPLVLTKYLNTASDEQKKKYGKLLNGIITRYNLLRYDDYVIDPQYVKGLSDNLITDLAEKRPIRKGRNLSGSNRSYEEIGSVSLAVKKITPHAEHEIVDINGKYVVPYVYTKVVSLQHLPVNEKKQKFFDMLLPSILVASYEIKEARVKLEDISKSLENGEKLSASDEDFLTHLLKEWEAKDVGELLNKKMVLLPSSIMLAQAALETGWGSSRFFTKANNTFGIWSFDSKEPRVKARGTRNGKAVFVKKYENLHESIIDYYKLIAKGPYEEYRLASAEADKSPYRLIKHLNRYSELGQEYVKRLRVVMRQSELEKYDSYTLDPAFML